MMEIKTWKKYGIEFLSIFIAVVSAFALNNWNENKRDDKAESKILAEISNGLKKDIEDIKINAQGHQLGISACKYWRRIIQGEEVDQDSLQLYYISLTRDFTSLQNASGYETLKSKGLEFIGDDSLRFKIISLYEYDFYTLKKLEEGYEEAQFHKNYYQELSHILAPNFIFDKKGNITEIKSPIDISEEGKDILLSHLLKIQFNRKFVMHFYDKVEQSINALREEIKLELEG
ncbi:MAG: DUF6090 family protein [Cyclobacteriaceae bacterium]